MTDDRVVEFAKYRTQTPMRPIGERGQVATGLLDKLRRASRVPMEDRAVLARNIGRLVDRFDPKNRREIALNLLNEANRAKRKRYIEFPEEQRSASARYASDGLAFAALIERIIAQHVRRGDDPAHSTASVIHQALRETSFRPAYRYQPIAGSASDAAFFVSSVDTIIAHFAQETDIAEYFELVSKYPIFPKEPWPPETSFPSNKYLTLRDAREPNDLYHWNQSTEDGSLQNYIPWWAPKCVIGHLYVPFRCSNLELAPEKVAEIKDACEGEITEDNWQRQECSRWVSLYEGAKRLDPRRLWHRMPIWLIVLPLQTKLITCLFASVYHRDDFQTNRSVIDGSYFVNENIITPCFTGLGEELDDDTTFFRGDSYEECYVRVEQGGIRVIGSPADGDIPNFAAERSDIVWSDDELPPWLNSHPVQLLLQLNTQSDVANAFSLAPRIFPRDLRHRNITWGIEDSETVFRPRFLDPVDHYTPLRQNTIAAYLLRNLAVAEQSNIFDELKRDVSTKYAAARELIEREWDKFRSTFESRYRK